MTSPLLDQSDKHFWHGYVDFYETHFAGRTFASILEFGILKGNSIRWLLERFPGARIDAIDILPQSEEWPKDPRVAYHQMDQSRRDDIAAFFAERRFDLIIEDGSHVPQHQVNCLVEGLPSLASGGLYILEDIQTSLPAPQRARLFRNPPARKGNALTALLAIEHFRRIGRAIDGELAGRIARDSLIERDEILRLDRDIANLWLYRRTHLPDRCYHCGSSEFDYSHLKCVCGVEIFSCADSMSFVIARG